MLVNKILLCVTFLPILTCADLFLTPAQEDRLKQITDLIFPSLNLPELPLEDRIGITSTIISNISSDDIEKCECVCSNGMDIRSQEDPCYKLKKCCETEDKIVLFPDSKPKGCGIRNRFGIGVRSYSTEAEFAEFPWTVALLRDSGVDEHNKTFISFQGGGSVIHPQVVLTTAHTVLKPYTQYYIRAGEWDTSKTLEFYPHQDREVKDIIIHYKFDKTSLTNDIALLILKEPLILSENVQPVCLPRQDEITKHGTRCYASGWGVDAFAMKTQAILKKVEVPIVARDICEELLRNTILGSSFFLAKCFICAGGEAKKDTCQGDGGSPLVCPISSSSNQYHQCGIVSWGVGCGESNTPGIYVNVALYRNWIDYHMERYKFGTSTYTYGFY